MSSLVCCFLFCFHPFFFVPEIPPQFCFVSALFLAVLSQKERFRWFTFFLAFFVLGIFVKIFLIYILLYIFNLYTVYISSFWCLLAFLCYAPGINKEGKKRIITMIVAKKMSKFSPLFFYLEYIVTASSFMRHFVVILPK